jgi:hypothetical protein
MHVIFTSSNRKWAVVTDSSNKRKHNRPQETESSNDKTEMIMSHKTEKLHRTVSFGVFCLFVFVLQYCGLNSASCLLGKSSTT